MEIPGQNGHSFRLGSDRGSDNGALRTILEFLKTSRRMDCSGYRPAMIQRRIDHRLFKARCRDYAEYLHLIQESQDELDCLLDALTINVTRFFRDTLVFEYIADKVLPAIMSEKRKTSGASLRVWSAGCATGEEPYSAAILISELFRKDNIQFPLFIFATDISNKTLVKAREAVYGFESVKNLKYRLMKQYFVQEAEARYRLVPETRDLVSFSHYNMLDEGSFSPSDSIFGNFDLVFCRNLLIYFETKAQDIIFSKLYRSLAHGGYLVLGESETPCRSFQDRFRKVTDCCHVYQKITGGLSR